MQIQPKNLCPITSKFRYRSYHHAQFDLREMLRRKRSLTRKHRFEIYPCRHCQTWHIGSVLKAHSLTHYRKTRHKPKTLRWRYHPYLNSRECESPNPGHDLSTIQPYPFEIQIFPITNERTRKRTA